MSSHDSGCRAVAMTRGDTTGAATVAASERLALALQAGQIGTWHWDLLTGVVDRDSSMDQLLGIEPRSAVPSYEEYLERVHPDDRARLDQAFREALLAQTPHAAAEHRIVRPDGVIRWVEAKAHLSFAGDGSPTQLVGIVMDITERRRSEEAREAALQAQEAAMRRAGAVERRIAMLARAADLLDAPLDLDAALQQVADLAIGVLADWCTVDLLAEGQVRRAAVAHRDPAMVARAHEVKQRYPQDLRDPVFRQIIDSLEPLYVHHLDDRFLEDTVADPQYRRILREFDLSSFVVVPLVAGGTGIGTITLAACHGRHLSADDVDIAADLGRRAGAAVEKTRLYADLRQTTQVLQSSLLPVVLPQIPGVTLSAYYRSGTEGMQIGGDFYDVFRTGPDRWWVVLGDVCGKGPAAAARTAAARYSVRALAPDTDDPALVLRRLNELLLEQDDEGQFTSLVLATFQAGPCPAGSSRTELALSVASAGHPAPLLLERDGHVRSLACAGTVVGVLPEIEVARVSLRLRPGQALLFHTDGATEARTAQGGLLGEEGLAALLAGSRDGDGPTRASHIAGALLRHTGGALRDDLALLALDIGAAG